MQLKRNPLTSLDLPLLEQDDHGLDDAVFTPFDTRLLFGAARDSGMQPQAILAGSRITPQQLDDPDARVSARQRLAVYRNLADGCSDPTVFLRAGGAATICSFGMYGYALVSSSTFLDAVRISFRYLKLIGPLLQKVFDVEGRLALFEARDPLALGPLLQPAVDFWFAFTVRMCREISRQAFTAERIELAYPRPAHASEYGKVLGCPVEFSAAANRLLFSADYLDLRLPRANELSFHICEEACAQQLEEMDTGTGVARQVRDLILCSAGEIPTLTEIAERLYTTPRTLRRRLAAQGTSYQQILNDVRKTLAVKFLRETNLSMEEIAERVGFSDSRNFRHAFKRWTDTTPSSLRLRH